MADTKYQPISLILKSRGIIARSITDQAPPDTYLNLNNAEEREEEAMSSRYGSVIITRDPDGTVGGQNWLLPLPIVSLSRLAVAAQNVAYRYAADVDGALWRRTGDTQGPYVQIASGLSGQPFSAVVNTCYASSIPYLFIADQDVMIKDSGVGSPTQIGITPPSVTAGATVYAPQIILVDGFTVATGYTVSNTTLSEVSIGTLTGGALTVTVNNFIQYQSVTGSGLALSFNGVVATPSVGPATHALLFDMYVTPYPAQFSAYGINGAIPGGTNTYTMPSVVGTVAASTTATVGKTTNLDFSQNNQVTDDDLIVLTLSISDPDNVQQVNVQFDINGSGYTGSYFTKSITPVYYQSGITGNTDPYTTLANQAYVAGLQNSQNVATVGTAKPVQRILATDTTASGDNNDITGVSDLPPVGSTEGQLQPATLATGPDAWLTIYMRRGDFLPVGTAGQTNARGWGNVTGWRVQVITSSGGSSAFGLNALYLQWGAGPSSFGGIGYDYRYTYFCFGTGTESNGSPIQNFSEQFGYVASLDPLIALRQPIAVQGYYSPDPQVTHVRIYRRGGTYGGDWYYLDQFPNVTGAGYFFYKDILPDLSQEQADVLALDNDVPITSTLQNPIYTTLSSPIVLGGGGPAFNGKYWFFGPGLAQVAGAFNFLLGQIVVVGTPQNLEQVVVQQVAANGFYATFRLQHAAGEPVQAFSIPAQPVDLIELAYGQLWWAGDPNNPHFLYYSKPGYPENVGPQNYIQVSSPSDPIMAVINFRGTLFCATLTTWYQIIGGQSPYAQPTGSKHGLVAKHGWTRTEAAVFYQSVDGIREFRGADGAYRSLPIEWLYRQTPQSLTPVPLVSLGELDQVVLAFQNNFVYALYPGADGNQNYRICWSTTYSRWRNDSVNATTMFYEDDTNMLLYAKLLTSGDTIGYAICQDRINDYDDGGWRNGVLQQIPISMDVQTPYQDLGKPHFPKQWNTVEVDVNTQGQDLGITLVYDNSVGIFLGTANCTTRQKLQYPVNFGSGIQAYRVSAALVMSSITVAPILYQMDIYAALLAAYRSSFDSYWIKMGVDTSKLVKQGYFDYTSAAAISVSLYADGAPSGTGAPVTAPYYTFTLPTNTARASVPERVRFPAIKLRMWRIIATSTQPFQFWSAPEIEWKPCSTSGYARLPLET